MNEKFFAKNHKKMKPFVVYVVNMIKFVRSN